MSFDPILRSVFLATLLIANLPSSACGQAIVVPPQSASIEGTSVAQLAGINFRSRQQFLIAEHLMSPLAGKGIDGVWFRRDGSTAHDLSSGSSQLTVQLSDHAVPPESASQLFAANEGAGGALVFSGVVSTPTSPPPGNDRWALDQTVRIAFTTPFPYTGGPLCIELRSGASLGCSANWPVDAARDDLDGSDAVVGQHCSGVLSPGRSMLLVNSDQLVIGSTARFTGLGRYMTPGYLLVGTLQPTAGIDLGALGMTGCRLHVTPTTTIGAVFATRALQLPQDYPGATNFDIGIPFNPALLGGSFASQLVNLETGSQQSNPAGITLSAALLATLATSASTLGMAMVDGAPTDLASPLPSEGVVITNRAPVLRLTYR